LDDRKLEAGNINATLLPVDGKTDSSYPVPDVYQGHWYHTLNNIHSACYFLPAT
jgi:hypothetical protein